MIKKIKFPIFRGYKIDKCNHALNLKNEYVVFSPDRVKTHFYNYKEFDLSDFDSNLLEYLDEINFWLSIDYQKNYWSNYLLKGHIINEYYGYPEWIGRSILTNEKQEIDSAIIKIMTFISFINANMQDAFIKIQSVVPCYEPEIPSTNLLKYIYTSCNYTLGEFKIKYEIKIVKMEYLNHLKNGILLHCNLICFDNKYNKSEDSFIIYAFTSQYFSININSNIGVFPPYILCEELTVEKIEDYLLKTTSLIQASSKQELLLKLSIFTDSFLSEKLLSSHLYKNLEFNFEPILFDLR